MLRENARRVATLSKTAVQRIADRGFDLSRSQRELIEVALILGVTLVITADPAAAQGSSLDGVIQVLENIKTLLQNAGLVLAAVSLMASGIAWMFGEIRLAKKLVRGAVIGVMILVLADPIVDFLTEPLR